jgi:hypothetical protein
VSRANLYVLFPDGTVRYGIYNGTSDIASEALYDDPAQAWEPGRGGEAQEGAADLPVRIATDYGGGCSWDGRATLNRITEGCAPNGLQGQAGNWISKPATNYQDGEPNWATYPPPITLDPVRREIEA